MLAGVDPHGPRHKVILVELLAELHRLQTSDPARLVKRVVVVEREIVLLLLVDRDPELLRAPHHGRVAVGHEIEQLDGMDVVLVVEEELPGLLCLAARLPGEAIEGHHVVPDADLGGLAQVVDDHGLLDVLVHQVEHALVGRLHPVVQRAAAGLGRDLP